MSNNKKDPNSSSHRYRSPASGYSKSILSAIKGVPFEELNSRSAVKSLANTGVRLSQIDKTSQKDDKKENKEKDKMKSTFKTLIGQSSSKSKDGDSSQRSTPKRDKNKKSADSERGRRSFSCEMAVNPPNHYQKTQSINQINTAHCQQQNIITSSNSLIGGSSLSVQSINPSSTPALGGRSPSAASSICSKDEKLVENVELKQPKIRLSICAKALFACANGQLQELRNLIKEYPELINYKYPLCYRYSCLHIAAKAGDKNIVQYLVRHGADVNSKDEMHCTPLHAAAKAGQIEMINILIEMGADKNIRDAHGMLYNSYLNEHFKQYKNEPMKHSKTINYSSCASEEDDSLSQSSNRSQISLNYRPHNYTFHSFRKPIGKAVRDFLNRK
uniref:ANK_REP_REGION domain-containing protein n=1 Tax=Meloidogyne hapla TaxID=6305 RepID=A0A1I8BVW0_MELHA